MNKNAHRLKNDWFFYNRIFSIIFVFVLTACQTFFKGKTFFIDQSFIVQWSYFSPRQRTRLITSPVYIKGNNLLRVDFIIPFQGAIGRLVLSENKMLLQMPFKKEFYEGDFNSQFFLPQFDSFPVTWFFAILKAKPLENWKCSSFSKNKTTCKVKGFTMEWIFKNSKWKQVSLMDSHQKKIKIKKLRVLRKKFNKDIFSLSLKGYKKQKILSLK